ncbi:MAG: hypothetical protein DI535_16410 [Citrobacter freundii]|nr:MAG: hypothetical protein DI535_16410 [Citrobacter freundii]
MKTLSPDILLLVKSLFEKNKWGIAKGGDPHNTFSRFCERLSLFEKQHQLFLLELSNEFIWIKMSEYLERFYESLFCILDQIDPKQKIYVYPLLEPYTVISESAKEEIKIPRSKSKSANFLCYYFEAEDWSWIGHNFIIGRSIKYLKKTFKNDDSKLFLVDDFVGSGETAIAACRGFLNESYNGQTLNPDNLKVISIAAQKDGIQRVRNELNVEVVSNIIIGKGIQESKMGIGLEERYSLMDSIEKILKVEDEMKYGYCQCEAMITFLSKTPNNTFPVYWKNTKTKMAPFPRTKVIYG